MSSREILIVLLLSSCALSCGRTEDQPPPPRPDAEPPAGGMRVFAGGSWSCSLDASGEPRCWGSHADAHLSPPAEKFTHLAVGRVTACGIRANGTLRCWPEGSSMRPAPTGRFSNVSVRATHACGIREGDRQVVCWGQSDFGAIDVPHGRFIEAAAGVSFSCALRESGEAVCWGKNDLGQSTPPAGTFVSIVAGQNHACALDADGVTSCWGEDTGANGQPAIAVAVDIGTCIIRPDETVACFDVMKDMVNVPKGPVKGLAIGIAHGCVVRKDDRIECWGSDESGQASPPR